MPEKVGASCEYAFVDQNDAVNAAIQAGVADGTLQLPADISDRDSHDAISFFKGFTLLDAYAAGLTVVRCAKADSGLSICPPNGCSLYVSK